MDLVTLKIASIYFASCIGIPSAMLYIYLCVIIIRKKEFHTFFYGLFLIRAIPDLLYFLDSILSYRMPALGIWVTLFEAMPKWLLALTYLVTPYTQHADNLSMAFILLNRWTAIAFAFEQKRIWRILFPIAIFIVLIVPLPFTLFVMRIELEIVKENGTSAFMILEKFDPDKKESVTQAMSAQSTISAFLFLMVCAFINALILWSYKKTKAAVSQHGDENFKIERKLLIYAVATFIGHLLIAILTLFIYIFASSTPILLIIFTQYPWIFDVGCIALPSWLLLWASSAIRAKFLADCRRILPLCFCFSKESQNTVIELHSSRPTVTISHKQRIGNSRTNLT